MLHNISQYRWDRGQCEYLCIQKRKLARLQLLLHGANIRVCVCVCVIVRVLALHSKEICIRFNILYSVKVWRGLVLATIIINKASVCVRVRSARAS